MERYGKKRKLLLILPSIAVILVCATSIGYAIYGDVLNTSNDTEPNYVIVTPQGANAYSDAFTKTLEYDTENRNGTITYILSEDQITEITVATVDHDVVILGEIMLNIAQTGGGDDYALTICDTSGTMTGTFYVGISTSEDNDTYSSWSYSAYTIGTGASFDVDDSIEYIKLRLFVDSSFQTEGPLATTPLQNVTFRIASVIE